VPVVRLRPYSLGYFTSSHVTECATTAKMVERFCEAGLIQYIYNLARSDSPELIKLSLKILSMTLRLGTWSIASSASILGCA
jgi:hypothetical protein